MNYLKQIPSSLWLTGCCLLSCCWSCSNEFLTELPATDGTPVKVVAEIEGTTSTKAGTTAPAADNSYDRSSFIDGDVILIHKTDVVVGANQQNYQYNSSSGEWTYAGSGNKPITLQLGAKYRAVFPALYNGVLPNQSDIKNYISSNRLETDKIIPASETLDFTGDGAFKHVNTKLSVTFDGDNALAGAITELKIKGENLSGMANGIDEITPYHTADDSYTWCCILKPKTAEEGTPTSITISLTYQGVSYQTTVNCGMLANKHYAYTLRIRNELLVVKNTIKGWTGESAYDGDYNGDNNTTEGGN